ncbi:CIC11C00000001777 [Sungouiella intermedia]|uniref:CIC11C00000001777 n=1 Tax=Sungouiella intermedia TaxID=45354 RepID=A0A1L0DKK8_9ASCO|nr:CIC11C00000001777 [[Candida] intermedia]
MEIDNKSTNEANTLTAYITRQDYGSVESEIIFKTESEETYWDQIIFLGRNSAPLIVTLFLQYSITVFAIFSVGQLGKEELAAVSLATITYNVGNSIFNGMATSLDTFCAQAHGSGNHRLVGMYFQRGTAMIMVTSIPVIIFWCFSASVLQFIVPQKIF